jgi:membrane protein involved in colicin uptake
MTKTPLVPLLEQRRAAEEQAERALAAAVAELARVEARQRELLEQAARAAARARDESDRRSALLPTLARTTGGDVTAGARWLDRLASDARRAHEQARAHADGALAAAQRTRQAAEAALALARAEREAIDKHLARRAAEERQIAERRAEDEASELALARRRSDR